MIPRLRSAFRPLLHFATRFAVAFLVSALSVLLSFAPDEALAQPQPPIVLCRDMVAKTFAAASPASVNPVFRCQVPGGFLGGDRSLRLTVFGVANTNGVTTPHHNFQVSYGGTGLITLPAVETLGLNLVNTPWLIEVRIFGRGTPQTQSAVGLYVEPTAGSGGDGGSTSGVQHHYGSHSAVAVDSTSSQEVLVTWSWPGPTFDAADNITYIGGMLELLP